MNAMKLTARSIPFDKIKSIILVITVIIICFNIFTVLYYISGFMKDINIKMLWDFHFSKNIIEDIGFRRTIGQSIYQIALWFIICMWFYSSPKFVAAHEMMKELLDEVTGGGQEAEDLWRHHELWVNILSWGNIKSKINKNGVNKNEICRMTIIKIIYTIIWISMMCVSIVVPIRQEHIYYHFYRDALLSAHGFITICLAFISMGLCMFSWWVSMEYGYFMSKVSKLKSITAPYGWTYDCESNLIRTHHISSVRDQANYYFNPVHPSQTHAFIQFCQWSSVNSISFLVASGLYTFIYGMVVIIDRIQIENSSVELLWLLSVTIPGIISLIPVVICPKLFIMRIHRIWKMRLIKEYEDKLNYRMTCGELKKVVEFRQEREYWTGLINEVKNDRMDVRNFEIIGSILSLLLNTGIMIATIVK